MKIARLITQTVIYKFSYNLIAEPGAFAAFRSFVFRFKAADIEEHLTLEEARHANMKLEYLCTIFGISALIVITEDCINGKISLINFIIGCSFIRSLQEAGIVHNIMNMNVPIFGLAYALMEFWQYLLSVFGIDRSLMQNQQTNELHTIKLVIVVLCAAVAAKIMLAVSTIKATTPLHLASRSNDVQKFRELVRRGQIYVLETMRINPLRSL
jgi:uncharacterized membrane protein